jgi:hypothetical protein
LLSGCEKSVYASLRNSDSVGVAMYFHSTIRGLPDGERNTLTVIRR